MGKGVFPGEACPPRSKAPTLLMAAEQSTYADEDTCKGNKESDLTVEKPGKCHLSQVKTNIHSER